MSLDQLYLLPEIVQQAILNGPALAPPPGTIPELDDPPNQNAFCLAVTTIGLSISTMAIILAAYAKLHGAKNVRYEDFFVLASYVLPNAPILLPSGLIVGVVYCIYEACTDVGGFVHQWNVRVKDLADIFYLFHVGSIEYSVGIMLLKVAILLQWTRLFVPRDTRGPFYWTCHAALWINILLYASVVIATCVSCTPFAKLWDPTLPGLCRVSREIIDICTAVSNLASDLIILLLPQPVTWKLKLKGLKKIGIGFTFCVGVFATVSAAFRVHASVSFFRSKDKTYQVASVALWGIAELTCGILIYCVPSIPKIFR